MPQRYVLGRTLLRRAVLAAACACALAPWLISCGDDARPPAPPTDTAARAREVFEGFHEVDPERIPSRLATNPGRPWGDFVGSDACKRCHEEDYAKWRGSFHSRTLYDAVTETVFGDFSGKVLFDDPEYAWHVTPSTVVDEATGKRRFFLDVHLRTVGEGGTGRVADADTYGSGVLPDTTQGPLEVFYAFGNRRHQPYVVRDKAGQAWVAPVYWDDIKKSWRYDGWRPYVRSCGTCHVTGIRTADRPWRPGLPEMPMTQPKRWNLAPAREQWAEGAVGCEVCHGPGRKHIEAVDRIGSNEYRRRLAAGTKQRTIYDGRSPVREHRMHACGSCHNFMTESSCTWSPGPKGYARDPLLEPLQPTSSIEPHADRKASQFYADGSHMSPCTVFTVYKSSKMYKQGVDCGHCHDPHGTDHWADLLLPVADNSLCISCHMDLDSVEAQTKHSMHEAGSGGNRCVECHMPRTMAFTNGEHMMSRQVHNHYFSSPTGKRRPGGPPSSCNVCHDDRTHKWTRTTIAAWKQKGMLKVQKADSLIEGK